MPKGKQHGGYQRPRKGEKRKVRQPFKVQKLGEPLMTQVLELLAKGQASSCICQGRKPHYHSFRELVEVVKRETGVELNLKQLYTTYDVLVAQAVEQVRQQDKRADEVLKIFRGRGFDELPAATVQALKAEVFGLIEAKAPAEREASLGNLLFLLAKITDALAKKERTQIEERKLKLAEKKFNDVKSKADKATNEAAEKLGKGKELTIADINSIRRKVFGLGPAPRSAA